MRMLFFLLGMISFISAGMLHVSVLGICGFVLAVIALFLGARSAAARHAESIIQLDKPIERLAADRQHATAGDLVLTRRARATRQLTRHSRHHQTRRVFATHGTGGNVAPRRKRSERV